MRLALGLIVRGSYPMSINIANEKRLLTSAEFEMVLKSHHPHMPDLLAVDFAATERQIRNYRDKARDLAHARRRAQRGKAETQSAKSAADVSGLALKTQIFAAALQRLGQYRNQMDQTAQRERNLQSLRVALDRKRNAPVHHPQSGRASNAGTQPSRTQPSSGLSDPREVGRVSQFVKNAQAQRDNRG
jgi:hypothetical protein